MKTYTLLFRSVGPVKVNQDLVHAFLASDEELRTLKIKGKSVQTLADLERFTAHKWRNQKAVFILQRARVKLSLELTRLLIRKDKRIQYITLPNFHILF